MGAVCDIFEEKNWGAVEPLEFRDGYGLAEPRGFFGNLKFQYRARNKTFIWAVGVEL